MCHARICDENGESYGGLVLVSAENAEEANLILSEYTKDKKHKNGYGIAHEDFKIHDCYSDKKDILYDDVHPCIAGF